VARGWGAIFYSWPGAMKRNKAGGQHQGRHRKKYWERCLRYALNEAGRCVKRTARCTTRHPGQRKGSPQVIVTATGAIGARSMPRPGKTPSLHLAAATRKSGPSRCRPNPITISGGISKQLAKIKIEEDDTAPKGCARSNSPRVCTWR